MQLKEIWFTGTLYVILETLIWISSNSPSEHLLGVRNWMVSDGGAHETSHSSSTCLNEMFINKRIYR